MFGRSKKSDRLGDKIKPLEATASPPAANAANAAAPAPRPTASASPPAATSPPGGASQPDLAPEELKRRAAAIKLVSAAFGQVVSVLMRAPHYKHYSLADLEWMVVPAMVTGQFSIVEAQSRKNGLSAPVCVVLWASVSHDVDQRLSSAPGEPIRLKPNEWRSGDVLWVIDAIGDARAVTAVLKRLRENEWQGRTVKLRTRGKDGKAMIRELAPRQTSQGGESQPVAN